MSLFNRRTLLMIPLALAACGFEPVYAPGGSAHALRDKVVVDAPDDLDHYLVVQNLETSLGRSIDPEYRLSVQIALGSQGQAVTAEGATTRYSLLGVAKYTLRKIDTQDIVASGEVQNFAGYSATGSTVETLATERDARRRLMHILADQITAQLYSTVDVPT